MLLTALGMMELCIHSPLAVHCLLTSAVCRSCGLQRRSRPSVEAKGTFPALKGGVDRTLILTPHS